MSVGKFLKIILINQNQLSQTSAPHNYSSLRIDPVSKANIRWSGQKYSESKARGTWLIRATGNANVKSGQRRIIFEAHGHARVREFARSCRIISSHERGWYGPVRHRK